jgi:uncharacterized protein (TIGR02444 family)
MTLTNTESNPFWEFSLSIYAQPGVAVSCLDLQEALQVILTQFSLFHACDAAVLAGFERVVKAAIRNLPADRRPG